MCRSIKSGVFFERKILRLSRDLYFHKKRSTTVRYMYNFRSKKELQSKKLLKNLKLKKYAIYNKSSFILENLTGLTFLVHNGLRLQNIKITSKMCGHRFGEFILTKKMGAFIHRDNKLAKKKAKILKQKAAAAAARKKKAVRLKVKGKSAKKKK